MSHRIERFVVQAIQSTRLEHGGPAQSVPKLTNALQRQGVPVVLFSLDHRDGDQGYAQVSAPKQTTWEGVLSGMSLWRAIQLVHIHGLWNPFQHRMAYEARRRRIPYVVSPRGMLEPWAMRHKRWKKRLAWWLYQRADLQRACLLHATATSEADQFRRLGLRAPTVVIPNGVDLPELASLGVMPAISPSKRTAVFLSRLHPKKGLPMLAEAWSRLDTQHWTMRVVGPDVGGHRRELEERLVGLGIRNWEFAGAMYGEDKSRTLRQAELFILPTYSENFGIAVAEALAHEVPVLTTTGTPWQGLEAERCGWWVEPSVEAIEKALRNALGMDAKALRCMGERGRAWMQRDFQWSVIAETMQAAYVEAVDGTSGRGNANGKMTRALGRFW